MRLRSAPIEVTVGREGEPAQFLWRERLWRVLNIEHRWIESGQWWSSSAVRAARGEENMAGGDSAGEDEDLLCETEVWRVEVANGLAGSRGVYEIVHTIFDGSWQLRAVLD